MSYAYDYPLAAQAQVSERTAFIKRTYLHLAGAVAALVAIEAALLQLPIGDQLLQALRTKPMMWLLVLGVFIGSGFVARWWAHGSTSPAVQYAGLALYVVVWAVVLLPVLKYASVFAPDAISKAAIMTLAVFGGLTAGVLITKNDFSFLGNILWVVSFGMLAVALLGVFGGFTIGLWFSFLGVAVACGWILYDTSQVLHHYRTNQHVGAALELFASLAMLFSYILDIVLSQSRD